MDRRAEGLARDLAEAGIWDDLAPAVVVARQAAVAGGAYPLNYDVFTDAEFLADGEELAEGGVDELLQAMAPALRGYGVVLEVQAGEVPEVTEDYIVQINGRRCRVWVRRTGLTIGAGITRPSGRWPSSTICWTRQGRTSARLPCTPGATRVLPCC
jgi:hypothetical protein